MSFNRDLGWIALIGVASVGWLANELWLTVLGLIFGAYFLAHHPRVESKEEVKLSGKYPEKEFTGGMVKIAEIINSWVHFFVGVKHEKKKD